MRTLLRAFLFILFALPASAQILRLAEMTTPQVAALDRAHTVIVLTDGIVEEHGPYLPTYTDGYFDEAIAQDLARTIVAQPGWTAVLFPVIPLGTDTANSIARKYVFPGSFPVRPETLREVYMDLADDFGLQGFRHILIVDTHGGPSNSRVLDQASDYFHATYGGRMTHLFGLMQVQEAAKALELSLTPEQQKENGMEVHAGALELSINLYLRPDLSPVGYKTTPSLTAQDFSGLMALAARPDWPGYLGAPRYASAAIGALGYNEALQAMQAILPALLAGKLDPSTLPRYGDIVSDMAQEIEKPFLAEQARLAAQHQRWLAARPGSEGRK